MRYAGTSIDGRPLVDLDAHLEAGAVSAVAMIASAWGASSESGRLRWTRTPRSTCAIAPSAVARGHVDEQGEVDAVALDERQLLEHLAAAGVLTGQRLHDGREVGEQERDQRPGHQLGDPPALARPAVERAVVEALDERHVVGR